jgi:hypothetical protein
VNSSIEFVSSGTEAEVASVVKRHLMLMYEVTEDQVSVVVSMVLGSSTRRLSSSPSWKVDFYIIADQRSAEHMFEVTQTMAEDSQSFAAALKATFLDAGLELDETSLSVAEPGIDLVIASTSTSSVSTPDTPVLPPGETTTKSSSGVVVTVILVGAGSIVGMLSLAYVGQRAWHHVHHTKTVSSDVMSYDLEVGVDLEGIPAVEASAGVGAEAGEMTIEI